MEARGIFERVQMTISEALCLHFAHLARELSLAFHIAMISVLSFLFAVIHPHIFNRICNFIAQSATYDSHLNVINFSNFFLFSDCDIF